MKNIMVPTDFSNNAKKAFQYALFIAARTGTKIHLIHAFTLLENTFIDRKSLRDAWNEEQEHKKRAQLMEMVEEAKQLEPTVEIQTELYIGPTESVLITYAKDHHADLIVMGTQGASRLAAVLVGSVAAAIISGSEIPVLAIPKDYPGNAPTSIVLATDEVDNDDTSHLEIVANLAEDLSIPVKVIMFLNKNESPLSNLDYKEKLHLYAERLRKAFPGITIESETIEGDHFEEDIQDYCNRKGIGILSMITYKRDFWSRIFRPSVTRRMAFHTTLPLLAIDG
jgi:nucleotide-binding universal stress UspA family protein